MCPAIPQAELRLLEAAESASIKNNFQIQSVKEAIPTYQLQCNFRGSYFELCMLGNFS